MNKVIRRLVLRYAPLFLLILPSGDLYADIIYNIPNFSEFQNGYQLSGTITTDGALFDITARDIIAIDLHVSGTILLTINSLLNPVVIGLGGHLVASPTQLQLMSDAMFYGNYHLDSDAYLGFRDETNTAQIRWVPYLNNYRGSYENISTGDAVFLWYTVFGDQGNPFITGTGAVWTIATADSPVPEPSTFALMGLGGVGLAIGAYRRRRATTV